MRVGLSGGTLFNVVSNAVTAAAATCYETNVLLGRPWIMQTTGYNHT